MSTTTTKTPQTKPINTSSTPNNNVLGNLDMYTFFATTTSGGVANAISRTVVAPFERARLQMSVDPTHYTSMVHCIRSVVHSEGIQGLWRGNVLNILRIYPQGAISFLLKDVAHYCYPQKLQDSIFAQPLNAMIAGGVSMSLVYPLDYVRVRMTVLPKNFYPNWFTGLKMMYNDGKYGTSYAMGAANSVASVNNIPNTGKGNVLNGINAIYQGLKYSNYWAMIYYGVQFTIYDQMKAFYLNLLQKRYQQQYDNECRLYGEQIQQQQRLSTHNTSNNNNNINNTNSIQSNTQTLISTPSSSTTTTIQKPVLKKATMDSLTSLLFGSISGCICMTTAYPLEAIRRKLQVQGVAGRPVLYSGSRDCARKIIKQHGWSGLYIGLGANMTKTPLSIGVTFACYEWMMKYVFKTDMSAKKNEKNV